MFFLSNTFFLTLFYLSSALACEDIGRIVCHDQMPNEGKVVACVKFENCKTGYMIDFGDKRFNEDDSLIISACTNEVGECLEN